jgi:hypothetical protein
MKRYWPKTEADMTTQEDTPMVVAETLVEDPGIYDSRAFWKQRAEKAEAELRRYNTRCRSCGEPKETLRCKRCGYPEPMQLTERLLEVIGTHLFPKDGSPPYIDLDEVGCLYYAAVREAQLWKLYQEATDLEIPRTEQLQKLGADVEELCDTPFSLSMVPKWAR